jgi:hypothetical protein
MKQIKHLLAVCLLLLVAATATAQSQSDNTQTKAVSATKADVNGDGVVNEADIEEILAIMQQENGTKYYWYAGWTEPTASNIATIVNEKYPSAKGSTTMNPAGKTSTTLAGTVIDFSTSPIYDQEGRNAGTPRYYYMVIPTGYGIYSTGLNMFVHNDSGTFTKIGEITNHTIYKFNQNAPYDIICNDFLSEDDINNIHLAEEAFDRFYNKDYYKTSINFALDNVNNHFNFFYQLGNVEIKSKRLEDTFKLLDDFVKENIDLDYDKFHQLLIIDYLNCFNIKPASWWSERISPKEKNEFLRECYENGKLTEDLNTLYKYSLVIPLKESTIVVIYKNNTKNIYII